MPIGSMKQAYFNAGVGTAWLTQLSLPAFSGNKAYFAGATVVADDNNNIYVAGYNVLDTKNIPAVYRITNTGDATWGINYTYGNSTTGTSYTSIFNQGLVANVTQGNVYVLDSSCGLLTFDLTSSTNTRSTIYSGATNINVPSDATDLVQSTNGNIIIATNSVWPLFGIVNPTTNGVTKTGAIYYNGTTTGASHSYSGLNIKTDTKPGSTRIFTSLINTRTPTVGTARSHVITSSYDKNGTVSWQRGIAHTSFSFDISRGGFCPDYNSTSTGNVYVGWRLSSYESTRSYITKYNAGTAVWTQGLDADVAGNSQTNINKILVSDIYDNVYGIGENAVGLYNTINIVKYDSNGNLQWQRTLQGKNPTNTGNLNVSPTDAVISGNLMIITAQVTDWTNYVSGNVATIKYMGTLITSLPSDGSATGTYTISTQGSYNTNNISYVYSTSSYASATPWANIDLAWTGFAFNTTSGSPALVANTTAINSVVANSTSTFGGPVLSIPSYIP